MKIFLDCNHGLQKWCHMSRSCLAREMTWWLRARLSSYFASQNSDDIYCVLFPLCKWHQLRCLSEIAIPIIIEPFFSREFSWAYWGIKSNIYRGIIIMVLILGCKVIHQMFCILIVWLLVKSISTHEKL